MDLWRGTMEFTTMPGQSVTYPALSPSEIYPHDAPAINLIDSIFELSATGRLPYLV